MKPIHIITTLLTLFLVIGYSLVKYNHSFKAVLGTSQQYSVSGTLTSTPSIIETSASNANCHIRGVLPDSSCTPGVIDQRVTQANIQQTICVSGYTKTVRPPVSYTDTLKREQIVAYGYTDTSTRDFEEDHLISLEIGGSPSDPKNLWPEPGRSPNPKDKIENLCHEKVCTGQITLAQAQQQIAINWPTACQ